MFEFLKKNKEEKKRKQEEENKIAQTLQEAREVQKGNLKIAEEGAGKFEEGANKLLEAGASLDKKAAQFSDLHAKNVVKEQSLNERETDARKKESEAEERLKNIRSDEILITARKAEVKGEESIIKKQKTILADKEQELEKRELESEKLAIESRKAKEEYEKNNRNVEAKEAELTGLEESLSLKETEINAREKESSDTFAKAKALDEEMSVRKRELEEDFESRKQALQEKTDEYDRKIADIDAKKSTVDGIKFDNSEDGRQAKIVVFDAIRKGEKLASDLAKEFEQLQEKYGKGTFMGFSTPLSQIDKQLEVFKFQAQTVKDHAKEGKEEELMQPILDQIDDHLLKATKSKDIMEYSEAFLHICKGLATCKNYSVLLEILDRYESSGGEEHADSEEDSAEGENEPDENTPNYYEILGIDENADEKTIKRAYRKMAQKFHPDRVKEPSPNASEEEIKEVKEKKAEYEEKFKDIQEAKSVLLDKKEKAKYDKKRSKH